MPSRPGRDRVMMATVFSTHMSSLRDGGNLPVET